MLAAQDTTLTPTGTETATVTALMAEPEAPISDAPVATPSAGGILVIDLLLSPKTDPKDK
jgi:hypothetical protein